MTAPILVYLRERNVETGWDYVNRKMMSLELVGLESPNTVYLTDNPNKGVALWERCPAAAGIAVLGRVPLIIGMDGLTGDSTYV